MLTVSIESVQRKFSWRIGFHSWLRQLFPDRAEPGTILTRRAGIELISEMEH